MDWLISANSDHYDYAASFRDFGFVDWIKEGRYALHDIVYVYATKPVQRILYKTRVDKIFGPGDLINDDQKYWKKISRKDYLANRAEAHVRLTLLQELPPDNFLTYDALRDAGLPCAPQTVMHLFGDALSFIQKAFENGKKEKEKGEEPKSPPRWNREIDDDLRGISPLLIPLVDSYRRSHSIAWILFTYYGDAEFCETLRKEAMVYIHKVYLHEILRQEERIIVLASLALISIRNYDGAFWPNVHETYSDLYDPLLGNNSQAMDGAIKDILTRGFDVHYASNQIIISIPVMVGVLSIPMLNDFINFVADIYRLNFENILSPSDAENQSIISEALNAIRKQNSDDSDSNGVELKIGSTPKLYNLSKYLIADINQGLYQEDLLSAMMVFLKKIDAYHWSRSIPQNGIFFDEGFSRWLQNEESKAYLDPTEAEDSSDLQTRERRICVPHFVMDGEGHFSLTTEPARLASETDVHSVAIEVMEDGQNSQFYTPVLKAVISGYLLRPLRSIPIHHILGRVSYVIRNEKGIIWSSGKTLYRDCVFFGEDGEEIFPGHRYQGSAFCLSRFPLIGEGVKNSDSQDGIFSYSLVIRPQSIYLIDSKKIFFDSYDHPGLFGDEVPDVSIFKEGKEIPLFRTLDCLVFETILKATQLALVCDGVRKPLTEIPFDFVQDGGINRFIISPKVTEGYHKIYVEEVAKEKILDLSSFAFVLDPLFQKTGAMVSGAFLPLTDLTRTADRDFVDLQASHDFAYRVYSSEPFFSLDEGPVERLGGSRSKNDFASATFIKIHCGLQGVLKLEEGAISTELALQKTIGHVGYYVINPIVGMLSDHEVVAISYTTFAGKRNFMDVHAHAFVNEQNVTINVDEKNGTASIGGTLHGKGNEEVRLQVFEKGSLFLDQVIDVSDFRVNVPNILPFTFYKYSLIAKPSYFEDFTPFSLANGTFSYTSEDGLIGHRFLLKRILFTNPHGGQTFTNLLHSVRLSVFKKDDSGDYLAKIEKTMGNHFEEFLHLPIVHIESIEERTTDTLSVKLASDEDVLFYDNKSGTVFDGETCDSIFTIDLAFLTICE